MGALIAGLDFSSKAIHAAVIPCDPDDGGDAPPVTLRHYLLPTEKEMRLDRDGANPAKRSVERCRAIREGMRRLLGPVGEYTRHIDKSGLMFSIPEHEVVHVCVEEPFGHGGSRNQMRELFGAILASIPPHIERDTITTHEWRRIIWPEGPPLFEHETPTDVDWKAHAVSRAFHDVAPHDRAFTLNEHEAEAYLIARACRTRLEKAVSA